MGQTARPLRPCYVRLKERPRCKSGPFLWVVEVDMPVGLILVSLLGPQIWAVATRKSAVFRMSLLSLGLAFLTAISWTPLRQVEVQDHDQTAGFQETYYIVPSFYHFGNLTLLACALTVLLAATARWAAPLPRATAWIASLFAVCMTFMASRPSWSRWLLERPKRYEEYEPYVAQLVRIDTYSAIISALIFWSLIVSCLIALLRRLNQWSKTD